ncbi:glycerophosphodiester phosphodiesterase [Nocardioides bruguierae]|uniref:Glycerophosphodiester phosphodiesterase n=1 Tax=Nocardioides bruguierae TaxID=2945102 RepID=A0A9X2D4S9_9ACTN|nr:glycerophosphodiester phosphodiesterase [Nocardioides bruguierae]MCM0619009.1 glycerophosphodiester phosphodiesterase [Nocardioides bruguierae]
MSTSSSASPVTGHAYLDRVHDLPGSVLAMAHRGGARHLDLAGLENTRTAFAHAVDLGYSYLETDVHATRDGVLLAFHDDRLDRVTDSTGLVADLPASAVRAARVAGREPVPTLDELLESFPGVAFNIDIKADAAVQPLVETIAAHRAWDRVLVGSFGLGRLRRFRALAQGRVPTSAAPAEVAAFVSPTSPRALRRRVARHVAALQVPVAQRVPVPGRTEHLPVVTERLVHRAHEVGVHVHVWTVDEPAEMAWLLGLGVDGLITDRTDVLRDTLTERGVWLGAASGPETQPVPQTQPETQPETQHRSDS